MPAPLEKPIIGTIQAQHDFTPAELNTLARDLAARMQEYAQTEAQLDSIKQDYKAKLTRIENDRDSLAQKIRDGFEMRPADAIVVMDSPAPGRKSYFVAFRSENGHTYPGAFIRDEPMTHDDKQRKLPLETNEQLTQVIDGATPPLPEGFYFVTQGNAEEGDLAWSATLHDWQNVATPGSPVGGYHFIARKATDTVAADRPPENEAAGSTPFGEALKQAAAGAELPLVDVELSDKYTADKCRAVFRKAAKKQGWPEAAIDLLDDEAMKVQDGEDPQGSLRRVLDVLNPHCVQGAK